MDHQHGHHPPISDCFGSKRFKGVASDKWESLTPEGYGIVVASTEQLVSQK